MVLMGAERLLNLFFQRAHVDGQRVQWFELIESERFFSIHSTSLQFLFDWASIALSIERIIQYIIRFSIKKEKECATIRDQTGDAPLQFFFWLKKFEYKHRNGKHKNPEWKRYSKCQSVCVGPCRGRIFMGHSTAVQTFGGDVDDQIDHTIYIRSNVVFFRNPFQL